MSSSLVIFLALCSFLHCDIATVFPYFAWPGWPSLPLSNRGTSAPLDDFFTCSLMFLRRACSPRDDDAIFFALGNHPRLASSFEFAALVRSMRIQGSFNRQYHILLDASHTALAHAVTPVGPTMRTNSASRCYLSHSTPRSTGLITPSSKTWPHRYKMRWKSNNPQKPSLSAWAWICDVDRRRFQSSIDALLKRPSSPKATALHYAMRIRQAGQGLHRYARRRCECQVRIPRKPVARGVV